MLQWFLKGGSFTRYWELPADIESLRMALSLVELHNPFKEGGMLCIDSSAIIWPVLDVIEEQQWSIHDLQVNGHLTLFKVAVIKSFARRVGAKCLIKPVVVAGDVIVLKLECCEYVVLNPSSDVSDAVSEKKKH
uniref:DUF4283 domain-containing protein n=1 Tax=Ascaris lumbricoides TaxID=6252 RepID=A0A0M3ICU7_ASCLU